MSSVYWVSLGVLLCSSMCSAAIPYVEPLPEMHTAQQLHSFFEPHSLGLIVYTTVECPSCKALISNVRSAVADVNKTTGIDVPVARITHDRSNVEVRGLYFDEPHLAPPTPSLGVVRYGNVIRGRWRGPVGSAQHIAEYITRALHKDLFINITQVHDAQTLLPEPSGFPAQTVVVGERIPLASIVVFGFFVPSRGEVSDTDNHRIREAFETQLEWLRDAAFTTVYVTSAKAVSDFYRVPQSHDAAIALYHEATPGEVQWLTPNGATDLADQIRTFLSRYARPYVVIPDLVPPLTTPYPFGVTPIRVVLKIDSATSTLPRSALLDNIAVPLRKKVAEPETIAVEMKEFESSDNHVSLMNVSVYRQAKQYKMPSTFILSRVDDMTRAVESILEFITRVREGNEEPYVRTQSPDVTDEWLPASGKVVTVVGSRFARVLQREGTVAFGLALRSTCNSSQCSTANTLVGDLAFAFRDRPDVVIAVVFTDLNDLPPPCQRAGDFNLFLIPFAVKDACEWYRGPMKFPDAWRYVASHLLDWKRTMRPPMPRSEVCGSEVLAIRRRGGFDCGERETDHGDL